MIITPGAVFEIRALMKDERERTWRESGYFNALDAAIRVLPAITRRATGIYLTLNPVIPDLWSRAANRMRRVDKGDTTGDQHIVRRTRILFDFDGTPVSGVSSTDAEHAKAQELACRVKAELTAEGWPQPLEGGLWQRRAPGVWDRSAGARRPVG